MDLIDIILSKKLSGGGSGGGVSSWNDMPAPIPETHLPEGYPHYGHGTVMRETTAMSYTHPAFGDMWVIEKVPDLKVGDTYTVKYNGGTWECQCVATPEGFVSDPNSVAMGNISAILQTGNTGEPFAMLVDNYAGAVFIIDLTGASTVRMGIEGNTLLPFDEKYLPGGIYTVGVDVDSRTFPSPGVADKTFAEVAAAAANPNLQVRAFLTLRLGTTAIEGYMVLNLVRYNAIGSTLYFRALWDDYGYLEMKLAVDGSCELYRVTYKGLLGS